MLGAVGSSVPEIDKAGIEIKTIRVNKNWRPFEAMSFPAFNYLDIINEDWEDSKFFEKVEQRFLFVIFRKGDDGETRLEKIQYWNMPYLDREEARRVWELTRSRVAIDASDLPKSRESRVAHVRPKARNASDTLLTPQGTHLVKKCFWLNKNYIGEVIRNI
jgi:DNA mismatch repair protein MutH